ncbi:MAG: hypothetical protein ABIZ52_07560 [Candidatus Limnocylindrales bacterium]
MITCRVCAAPNEAEASFCGTCGAPLAPVEAIEDSTQPVAIGPAPIPEPGTDPVPVATRTSEPVPEPESVPALISMPPKVPLMRVAGEAPVLKAGQTACPNCGTGNPPSRLFCMKCATELNPAPLVKRPLVSRGLVVRFLLSAGLSTVVVISGAAIITRLAAASSSSQLPVPSPVTVTDQGGVETEVGLVPGDDPQPIAQLPATTTIQLASYQEPSPTETGSTGTTPRARWWNDSIPRIPAISQFDGSRLQGVNCVMASGAMLARLAFGIVTSGSQLRALSRDTEGATSFRDLQNALFAGWGIKFSMGAATPLQFRALLYAGAGAEVIVDYGAIPARTRLSPNFTGNHAIYIDAFRPAGVEGATEAAYYVMDPIGHTWSGYKGEWWPAEMVERAAGVFGGGKIVAAWAFAGGVIPFNHPILPPAAYPPRTPGQPRLAGETLAPGETLLPGETLVPLESLAPVESLGPGATRGPGGGLIDRMPFGDLALDADVKVGETPPDAPTFPGADFFTDRYQFDTKLSTSRCTVQPVPLDCPTGIIGVLGEKQLSGTTEPLKLLYADVIGPGMYQIIYESPPSSDSELLLWNTRDGGTLQAAKVESGLIGSMSVSIATITVDPTLSYSFVAATTSDGIRTVSDVGSLLVK